MRLAPTTTTTRTVANQSNNNGHDAEIPDGESSDDTEWAHLHSPSFTQSFQSYEAGITSREYESHEFCKRAISQSECLYFSHAFQLTQPNHVNETCWYHLRSLTLSLPFAPLRI